MTSRRVPSPPWARTECDVECVLFDYGGTLDADGVAWKTRFRTLFHEHGVRVSAAHFDRLFYRVDDALVGTIPASLTLRETAERLSEGMLEALGLHWENGVARRLAARFEHGTRERIAKNTGLLARLHDRFRLGIVSNFYGNLPAVCADLGISGYFDVIVDSVQAGCEKPDACIFDTALRGLGAEASRAMLVGDSLHRDMHGARALGMRHAWLRGPACADAPCCAHDPVLRTLGDLRCVLPG